MLKKIFILEDDPDHRDIMEIILEEADYNVKSFPDLKSFKGAIVEEVPDLVVMDLMLPDGNSLEICKELKETPATSHIPILVLTAHTNPLKIMGVKYADEFIAKPFDNDEFERIVANHLSER